jgi:hypothetical protein
MFSAAAVRRDTEIMLNRAVEAGIPLVIGSAGTGGGDAGLAWTLDIVRERGLHFKLAAIHSEVSKEIVPRHVREGRARPLPPSPPLT